MKVGILGTGYIAVKMAETINRMEEAECFAVASRSLKKAEAFKQDYHFKRAYGSYEDLVRDEEIDLVYIATPHSRHYEDALLSIEHGKAVLCEKPFMVNADQARTVVERARAKKVFLAEAIWTRYMPSRTIIDDVIRSGKIGTVTSLSANVGYDIQYRERIRQPELAGGALLDLGVYCLHFARMFLGSEVTKSVSLHELLETGVDAVNSISLKYKNGQIAGLYCSVLEAAEQQGIIRGSKGCIIAKNLINIDEIEIFGADRELIERIAVPEQISGYEYEILAVKKALEEGRLECEEIPLDETIGLMEQMDGFRAEWGIRFPFEKVKENYHEI